MAAARFHDVSEEDDKQNKRKFSCSDYHLSNYTKTIIFLRLGEYCQIIIFIQQYSLRLRRIIVKCLFFFFSSLRIIIELSFKPLVYTCYLKYLYLKTEEERETKTNKAEGSRDYLMFKLLCSARKRHFSLTGKRL